MYCFAVLFLELFSFPEVIDSVRVGWKNEAEKINVYQRLLETGQTHGTTDE